ncbi:hypothetical protein ACMD2_17093, partial [Ananas comosus]
MYVRFIELEREPEEREGSKEPPYPNEARSQSSTEVMELFNGGGDMSEGFDLLQEPRGATMATKMGVYPVSPLDPIYIWRRMMMTKLILRSHSFSLFRTPKPYCRLPFPLLKPLREISLGWGQGVLTARNARWELRRIGFGQGRFWMWHCEPTAPLQSASIEYPITTTDSYVRSSLHPPSARIALPQVHRRHIDSAPSPNITPAAREEEDMRIKFPFASLAEVARGCPVLLDILSQFISVHLLRCRTWLFTGHQMLCDILFCHHERCFHYFRMSATTFIALRYKLIGEGLKSSTRNMTAGEHLAIFLFGVGHGVANQILAETFQYSGETISRYFNNIVRGIVRLKDEYIMLPSNNTAVHSRIRDNPNFYPFKYYLVNSRYTSTDRFLTPYGGERYHISQFDANTQDHLYNHRHAQLRNVVEKTFGILKKHFKILNVAKPFSYKVQCLITMACYVIHNFIRRHHANDSLFSDELDKQDAEDENEES